MKLSEILRNYRQENDLSQREFAKRCGLSNSYISFLENECNPKTGKPMTPTIEQYKRLADAMSMTLHDLIKSLDTDSPVVLNDLISNSMDLQYFADEKPPDAPVTHEARILAKGIDKLPKEQREQALAVVRAMFSMHEDYFKDEGDQSDDT